VNSARSIAAAAWLVLLGMIVAPRTAPAHDIPDARIDRAIQVELRPGGLMIAYEVGLAELTLVQDLRNLVGPVPAHDRMELFDRYAREVAPLNAKGILVDLDGRPLELITDSREIAVEEHPRLTFHYRADLPAGGRLVVRDTNYASSEGSSRLALRAVGLTVVGYDGPTDIATVPIRPLWQLSDEQERATKEVVVTFRPVAAAPVHSPAPHLAAARSPGPRSRLGRLLDRADHIPVPVLGLLALTLGMAHAFQPGHGKTLVAAASLGPGGGPARAVLLALVTTAAHLSGVLALAGLLALTRASRYAEIDRAIAQVAGFMIAFIGLWRLGRHLGGHGEHGPEVAQPGGAGIVGLGLAGGIVPCWDAVLLVLLSDALGRLTLGIALVGAFSLGMGLVLVVVGLAASRIRGALLSDRPGRSSWERRLGAISGVVLTGVGLAMLYGPR
jgi:ABC-type nickel/cobalt efflux system permease component RcnA